MPPIGKFQPMGVSESRQLSTRIAKESSGISVRPFKACGGFIVLNLSDGSTVRDTAEWETHPRNVQKFKEAA